MDDNEALAAMGSGPLSGPGGGPQAGGFQGPQKGGGGRRRPPRGSGPGSRAVQISHALSRLLRHQAPAAGIALDAEGFARLDEVLAWPPLRALGASVAEVRDVVATNDKQRFALRVVGEVEGDDPSAYRIRANQGHSIPGLASDGGLLAPLADAAAVPAVVAHGTYFALWPAIEAAGGLRRMGRNHVHCGGLEGETSSLDDLASAVVPGVRRDAQLLVVVDVRRALREDPALRWWRAANGVVLTEGDADGRLPARFFQRVVVTPAGRRLLPKALRERGLVLWADGRKVADLPAETLAHARVPQGKGRARTQGGANKEAEAGPDGRAKKEADEGPDGRANNEAKAGPA